MKFSKDTKGFTLIEFIVVMVISVILMGIAGSIYLSATGFFTKTVISDQAKLAADKIAEFVIEEVKYSSAVVVSNHQLTEENKDTHKIEDIKDWHYFYVNKDNGRLYYDSVTKELYGDSYYSNRKLQLVTRKYETYRLDLKFAFIGNKDEEEYKTFTTIVLSNVKLLYDNTKTTIDYISGTEIDSMNPGTGDGVYIYYKKDAISIESNINTGRFSGTVADQIQCLTGDVEDSNIQDKKNNNKGIYKTLNQKKYSVGDFVFLCSNGNTESCSDDKKIWYRYMHELAPDALPGANNANNPWKLISADYGSYAPYYAGDVIKYTNNQNKSEYFMYIGLNNFLMSGAGTDKLPGGTNSLWVPVTLDKELSPYCELNRPEGDARYINAYIWGTHAEKISKWGISKSDLTNEYKAMKQYPSSLNKFQADLIEASDIVVYNKKNYLNLSSDYLTNIPPGSTKDGTVVWYALNAYYEPNTIYHKDDIVIFQYGSTDIGVFKAKQGSANITPNPYNNTEYWERVSFNLNSGEKGQYEKATGG